MLIEMQYMSHCLVEGGSIVDDSIMDLLALSDFAIDDDEIMQELKDIEELIALILSYAREKSNK